MQHSFADDPRERVVRVIIALERSCLGAEAAFVERRWPDVDAAFREQAALSDELRSLFEEFPETAGANDARVDQRLRGILRYRDEQLGRLIAYRDDVATRLSSIGKVNAFSRSLGKRAPGARLLDSTY